MPAPNGQVVWKTIVNLDKSPVPLVFVVQARHTSAHAMRLDFCVLEGSQSRRRS